MRSLIVATVCLLAISSARSDRFGIDEAGDVPPSFWGSLLWIAVLVVGYILFKKK